MPAPVQPVSAVLVPAWVSSVVAVLVPAWVLSESAGPVPQRCRVCFQCRSGRGCQVLDWAA